MELLHHAGVAGQRPAMMRRLFQAYFVEGRHVGSIGELADLAAGIGLDPVETRAALEERRYRSEVDADVALARKLGATGAPFYTGNDRWGIAGAQSSDAYLDLLQRAAAA
jgi:predicted DsbA family dithiol-disulfide isomerase